MKAKAWQIVVIAVALVAVGVSLWFSFGNSGPRIPSRFTLIDVTSGQLYDLDTTVTRVVLPARSPDDGGARLVPVVKDDKGHWVLTGSAKSMVRGMKEGVKAVDPESGAVLSSSSDVKKYTYPKGQ